MIVILEVTSEILALRFQDYVRSQYQIDLSLRKQARHYQLLISEQHEQLDLLLKQVTEYQAQPDHPKYLQSSWDNGTIHSTTHIADWFPAKDTLLNYAKQAPLTIAIAVLCSITFLLTSLGFSESLLYLTHFPANSAQYSEFWRWFSHALMHLSLPHFIFNLTWWILFAHRIEQVFGYKWILLLFFSSAILSGVVQNYFSGANFFGLSGVVYAVLGFVYLMSLIDSKKRFILPSGFVYLLIFGIAIGLINPLSQVQFANAAHITGLIVGLCLALIHYIFAKNHLIKHKL